MLVALLLMTSAAGLDLPALKQRGTLKVLVFGEDEDILPRAGSPKARDRELLAELCEREGLKLEVIAEPGFDRLFTRLLSGEADVLAHGLTITDERKAKVAFTLPVATVNQVLVGRRGAKGLPRKPRELKGREVTVHDGSAYAQTLSALGARVVAADERLDSEGVVYEVGRGKIGLTVTDSNLFVSIASYNRDVEALFTVAEGKELAWAVRPDAVKLKGALDAFLVEKALTAHSDHPSVGDLDAIKKRGALRLITWNDPISYFSHQGQLFGFDLELARMIAARLKVRLEVVVPPERELLVPWLLEGRGDLVAACLHPVQGLKGVAFSAPYLFTDEVRLGKAAPAEHRPDLTDDVELTQEGKAKVVDRILIDTLPDAPRDFTVTVKDRPIVFAVRAGSKKLLEAVDGFVGATYRGLEYNLLRKRYFEQNAAIAGARAAESGQTGTLSEFDALFRTHASRTGLDWRLVAAQCFQESRFDPAARSWAGALGLFQLMPTTALELGCSRREDPAENVRAGTDYVARLLAKLDPRIELKHRLRFALAAYNAGPTHVEDARRLAAERGLDPMKWFGHVEKAMLLLEKPQFYRRTRAGYCRGSEPVKYVSEIQSRYDGYVKLVQ
ncbi:MAG: transporter substrate-binding domain-containing protein [Archangiaceae bacterium]|nr:transporter substrate-binding domain-containing protein [Archangiaceae bacterium]